MLFFYITYRDPDFMDDFERGDDTAFDFEASAEFVRDRTAEHLTDIDLRIEAEHLPSALFVTHAPEEYDGFGTRWVASLLPRMDADRREPGRIVDVLHRHREWQEGRYRSGMYFMHAADASKETLGFDAFNHHLLYRDDRDPAWASSLGPA